MNGACWTRWSCFVAEPFPSCVTLNKSLQLTLGFILKEGVILMLFYELLDTMLVKFLLCRKCWARVRWSPWCREDSSGWCWPIQDLQVSASWSCSCMDNGSSKEGKRGTHEGELISHEFKRQITGANTEPAWPWKGWREVNRLDLFGRQNQWAWWLIECKVEGGTSVNVNFLVPGKSH